jgi:lipoate-protein ligase A
MALGKTTSKKLSKH